MGITYNAKINDVFVDLMTAGVPAFSPNSVAGLQLWLDAQDLAFSNGEFITAWADKSPAARTVTVVDSPPLNTNQINGHQTARFEDKALSVAHHVDLNMHQSSTVFVVTKTLQLHQGAFVGKGTGGVPSAYDYFLVANKPQIDRPWVAGGVGGTVGLTAGTPYVLSARVDGTAVTHHMNGVANGSSTLVNGAAGTTALEIGRFSAAGLDPLRAQVGELLVFNVAVADTDREAIEDYLLAKWGFV